MKHILINDSLGNKFSSLYSFALEKRINDLEIRNLTHVNMKFIFLFMPIEDLIYTKTHVTFFFLTKQLMLLDAQKSIEIVYAIDLRNE
jgi:hypothetical protein